MPLLLILTGQVAGPPDTAHVRPRVERPCPPQLPGADIIVCARSTDSNRLRPLPEKYARRDGMPKAEVGVLGNAKLSAEVDQGADAQGGAINRAMVRLKIPF